MSNPLKIGVYSLVIISGCMTIACGVKYSYSQPATIEKEESDE
ncbi:hypothetical protein [Candidatus Mycoplasma haematohominis]|uniref:Lipoprotein n=1 Tax=Candidatus Mycoplasma haematohominis TaxID=1494318 RepID=A0A478FU72_9MOLU|nr:hypothetical protein MHSWG343_06320 [Candidatus Mycoplasma haemohominis]